MDQNFACCHIQMGLQAQLQRREREFSELQEISQSFFSFSQVQRGDPNMAWKIWKFC
jgi:hypothetical protein